MQKRGRARTQEEAKQYPYYDEDYDMSYSEIPSNKVRRRKEGWADEYVVTPQIVAPTETEQNLKHRKKIEQADQKVQQTALTLPGMLESIGLNFTSPTQVGRGIYESVVNGDNFLHNVYFGNNGVFSEDFAKEHPYVTNIINSIIDSGTYGGATKFYRWGTTPKLIGSGAEANVYSAPFSRKVYKVGLDPETVVLKNSTAETIPYKLVGYTIDKKPVFSQRKVKIPTQLNIRKVNDLYQRLLNKGFIPNYIKGEPMLDVINYNRGLGVTDIGVGNYGQYRGRYYLIDPGTLPLNEYMTLFKNGGKVVERFKKYQRGGNIVKFVHGGKGVDARGQYQPKDYLGFSGDAYQAAYKALLNLKRPELTHKRIVNLSKWITMHKAMESGYGSNLINNFNYGGYGGTSPMRFNNMDEYITRYVTDAQRLYPGIFTANNFQEYIKALFPEGHGYNPLDTNGKVTPDPKKYDPQKSYEVYWDQTKGMQKRVNQNIDLWISKGYNKR